MLIPTNTHIRLKVYSDSSEEYEPQNPVTIQNVSYNHHVAPLSHSLTHKMERERLLQESFSFSLAVVSSLTTLRRCSV